MSCNYINVYMHVKEINQLIVLSQKRFKIEKSGEFLRRIKHSYRTQNYFILNWLPFWIRPKLKSVKEIANSLYKQYKSIDCELYNPYFYVQGMHWREESICSTLLNACKYSCEDKILVSQEALSIFESTKSFFESNQHSSSVNQ